MATGYLVTSSLETSLLSLLCLQATANIRLHTNTQNFVMNHTNPKFHSITKNYFM